VGCARDVRRRRVSTQPTLRGRPTQASSV
jgi:hypothetical protein